MQHVFKQPAKCTLFNIMDKFIEETVDVFIHYLEIGIIQFYIYNTHNSHYFSLIVLTKSSIIIIILKGSVRSLIRVVEFDEKYMGVVDKMKLKFSYCCFLMMCPN